MKIRVNYDLLEEIKEAQTGFSLKRGLSKVILYSSIATSLYLPLFYISENPMEQLIREFSKVFLLYLTINYTTAFAFKSQYKEKAIGELKRLSSLLREIYINTDYELLKKAYQYETNYSILLDENKTPRLKQDKYIRVPVVDRDGEKEVSLIQEHLIGSKEYELSYGSRKKVLKPAVSFG